MLASATDIWREALAAVKEEIGAERFDVWFRNTEIQAFTEDIVEVGVPNLFVASWLNDHYGGVVLRALAERLQREVQVRFVANGKLYQRAREEQQGVLTQLIREGACDQSAARPQRPKPRLRMDFTFETFIVDNCNRLAFACAQEVVAGAQSRFNPLFLHGSCGVGKTHIVQAICHAINHGDDGRHAEYVSAETFTNEFTFALRQKQLDAFRHKYRRADVLLIDDAHFFCNKSALQEELLHTFDALDMSHRRIVIASDAHPHQMAAFHKSLVSRFVSGMVVALDRPGFETRLEIIRQMTQRLHKRLDEEVLRYIALRFEGSVRELQGGVHTMLAYAALSGGSINLASAREVFSALPDHRSGVCTLDEIEEKVCAEFALTKTELRRRTRARSVTIPRQACMYLGRALTQASYGEIARHFGTPHHTTVIFAERSIRQLLEKDAALAQRIEAVAERLRRNE